jgi:hypothetical protein
MKSGTGAACRRRDHAAASLREALGRTGRLPSGIGIEAGGLARMDEGVRDHGEAAFTPAALSSDRGGIGERFGGRKGCSLAGTAGSSWRTVQERRPATH